MLMFKNDESFSIAFRHFGHKITGLAIDLADDLFTIEVCQPTGKKLLSSNDPQETRDKILSIVDRHSSEFKVQLMRLAETIAMQPGDDDRLMTLRLAREYSEYLTVMVSDLYRYNGLSTKFDDTLVEYATTLNAVNAQQFIQLSRDKKHEKLALMLDEKRLSLWAQNFRYDEWKEASLKNEILSGLPDVVSDVLEREMRVEADEVKPDMREIEDRVVQAVEDMFYFDVADTLKDVSDEKLVHNDSLSELQATIPEVMRNILKRLDNFITSHVEEEVRSQLEEYK